MKRQPRNRKASAEGGGSGGLNGELTSQGVRQFLLVILFSGEPAPEILRH
jgi:hypothetical protein